MTADNSISLCFPFVVSCRKRQNHAGCKLQRLPYQPVRRSYGHCQSHIISSVKEVSQIELETVVSLCTKVRNNRRRIVRSTNHGRRCSMTQIATLIVTIIFVCDGTLVNLVNAISSVPCTWYPSNLRELFASAYNNLQQRRHMNSDQYLRSNRVQMQNAHDKIVAAGQTVQTYNGTMEESIVLMTSSPQSKFMGTNCKFNTSEEVVKTIANQNLVSKLPRFFRRWGIRITPIPSCQDSDDDDNDNYLITKSTYFPFLSTDHQNRGGDDGTAETAASGSYQFFDRQTDAENDNYDVEDSLLGSQNRNEDSKNYQSPIYPPFYPPRFEERQRQQQEQQQHQQQLQNDHTDDNGTYSTRRPAYYKGGRYSTLGTRNGYNYNRNSRYNINSQKRKKRWYQPVQDWWTTNIQPNIKNWPKIQCRVEPTTTLKIRKTFRPLKTIIRLSADFNTQLGVWQFKSTWEDAIIGGKLTLSGKELQFQKSWQLAVVGFGSGSDQSSSSASPSSLSSADLSSSSSSSSGSGSASSSSLSSSTSSKRFMDDDLVTRLRFRAAIDLQTWKAYARVGFRTERLSNIISTAFGREGFAIRQQIPLDGGSLIGNNGNGGGHVKLEVKANVILPEPEIEYSTERQRSLIGMGDIEVGIEELNLLLDY